MNETTTFDDRGRTTIRDDGLQVIQVFEGDGEKTFEDRYERPMWYTEVLFDHLAKHDGLGMHQYMIDFYRKSLARREAGQASTNVTEIRACVRARYLDKMHDCRIAAMVADQEWKVALGV